MYKHNFRKRKFSEQSGLCYYCGTEMSFNRTKSGGPARDFATFEHLTPRIKGGRFNETNIVLAHRKCNSKRNVEMQQKRVEHDQSRSAEIQ